MVGFPSLVAVPLRLKHCPLQFVRPFNIGKMAQKRSLRSPQKDLNPLCVHLATRRSRQTVYVKIPVSKSFDRASYKPPSLYPQLGHSRRHNFTRVSTSPVQFTEVSQPPLAIPPFSAASDKSYDPDSDSNVSRHNIRIQGARKPSRKPERIKHGRGWPPRLAACDKDVIEVDEATTCHQCRRKTTREKMRCRNLFPNGTICSFRFCQICIEVQYVFINS